MGVADHGGNAGEGGDFLRSALRITSGDDDFCQGILAFNAADGGPRVLIRSVGDGAGVENDEIGLGGRSMSQPTRFELAFERGAIGLRGAAPEVFYVVGGHGTYLNVGFDIRLFVRIVWKSTPPRTASPTALRTGGSLPLGEALPAQNWASLAWSEGHCRILAALRAGGASFNARVVVAIAG